MDYKLKLKKVNVAIKFYKRELIVFQNSNRNCVMTFLHLLILICFPFHINQPGDLLFCAGDDDLPRISIPRRFQCFCHSSFFRHFVSPSNIFSRYFPLLCFLRTFKLSQDVLVSLFSSYGQNIFFLHLYILFRSDLDVSASRNTDSFDSLQSIST